MQHYPLNVPRNNRIKLQKTSIPNFCGSCVRYELFTDRIGNADNANGAKEDRGQNRRRVYVQMKASRRKHADLVTWLGMYVRYLLFQSR